MSSNIFILLRQELLLSLLIFILLFIKIGKERSNETVLNLINILLFVNLAAGLFGRVKAVFSMACSPPMPLLYWRKIF
jgi:NADH-quinone oxidoreductase subunit N